MVESDGTILLDGGPSWEEARQLAGAFLAGFQSPESRRGYRSDLRCWFGFCRTHDLHPFRGIPRIHLELYLRQLETTVPRPANAALYRRISTLSSWFRWLEDEEFNVGSPAARMRRPTRHCTSEPWLDRNQLTDVLVASEDEGGDAYAMTCLLALNGLRVSEACNANVTDLGGSRYQPTLRILGKGGKPAEIVLNPRTWQAIDQVVDDRSDGPLLHNRWGNRMRRHNVASILVRLAKTAGIRAHVTPHALRRSYITIGLQQGVPLREMQRAARHTKADTTIAYDQSARSFHRDPTFVLMSATAR